MNLFNEYGMLAHQPSLELSNQIHRLVAAHCQQLVDVGCSPVEIRALGSYLSGEGAIAETVLRHSMKKSRAERGYSY